MRYALEYVKMPWISKCKENENSIGTLRNGKFLFACMDFNVQRKYQDNDSTSLVRNI